MVALIFFKITCTSFGNFAICSSMPLEVGPSFTIQFPLEMESDLYFLNYSCIKIACIQNLTDFTTFIAYVRQFVFSGSKTDRGYAQADRCHGVGAEIPEIILFGFVSKVFLICGNASLSKFMLQVDLPGEVEWFIFDIQACPTFSVKCTDFPGCVLAFDELIHLLLDISFCFARNHSSVKIHFTLRRDSIQRVTDAGNSRHDQRASRRPFLHEL